MCDWCAVMNGAAQWEWSTARAVTLVECSGDTRDVRGARRAAGVVSRWQSRSAAGRFWLTQPTHHMPQTTRTTAHHRLLVSH